MEEIVGSDQNIYDNEGSEEILLGAPERSYMRVLREAHNLLLSNRRFAYDVVNECNMIKVGIRDLVRSTLPEAEKYAILLQLGAEANLQVDPRFTLFQIGSVIQDYYMNTCLSINPEVGSKLALLWGKGVKQQVKSYGPLCRSIAKKVEETFSYGWVTPRHVITMLYDPEIGFLASHEYDQAAVFGYNPNVDEHNRRGAKHHASHVLVWKVNEPETYQSVYDSYEQAYAGNPNVSLGDYVSRDNKVVSEAEGDFFREYHKYNEAGVPYVFTADRILQRFNEGAVMTAEERNERGEEGIVPVQLSLDEADFIMMVQQRFIRGEYPIDMLWEDICRTF